MNVAGEFNARGFELLTPFGWPVTVAAILLVTAGLVMSLRGLHTYLKSWQRTLLVVLRISAAAAVIFMFLQPAVVYKKVSRVRSRVAVLVDRSRSMSLPTGPDGRQRFSEGISWLRGSKAGIDALGERFVLDFRLFDSEAVQVAPSVILAGDMQPPDGAGTDLLRALDDASSGELPLSGVVMLTDGADRGELNRSFDPESGSLAPQMKAFLGHTGAPVHVFIPGKKGAVKDAAVVSLDVPAVAFAGAETEVTANVQVSGFEGVELPVVLRENGIAVQSRSQKLVRGRTAYKIPFKFTPKAPADELLSVSLPVLGGEAVATNNEAFAVLKVTRDKVRVLHVAGGPSWDVRFLRQYFKRTPGLDLISFFILRTLESRVNAPDEELSLIPFPTDEVFSEHLSTFDAVFFQDFNFGPYGMRGYLPGLARYVAGGGGLMVAGGNRSLSTGEYRASELDPVLPITLASGEAAVGTEQFQPVLSEAGRRHPITALSTERAENESIWKTVPSLNGMNLSMTLRDGAQVLLEHPFKKMPDGRPQPLLAVWEYGKGRAAVLMTDESWRWEFGEAAFGESRVFSRFYENMLKWMSGDPSMRRFTMDPVVSVRPGSPAALSGRVLGPDYSEDSKVRVKVTIRKEGLPPAVIDSSTINKGRFSVPLKGFAPGVYDAEATVSREGVEVESMRQQVLIDASDPEMSAVAPNAPLMEAVASATRGGLHFTGDGDLGPLEFPDKSQEVVNKKEYRMLCDRSWMIILVAAIFAAEWALRRRWGQQ